VPCGLHSLVKETSLGDAIAWAWFKAHYWGDIGSVVIGASQSGWNVEEVESVVLGIGAAEVHWSSWCHGSAVTTC
jgi:hypothetical protein